ncbi:nuclear transport factor 2 family protein [Nonomuraea sp. LP-02]|uniref:YybH family protein n=1 Tax=Nonomuraea sp. LP-02 TaxID=3097960 RepID=UPI002E34C205|nr:nuclear transport factor 2 family protein [Nonomuraea sp. LP-02]MED7924404.1 nuclear transport factor 2 family protein [Nonomuraea sp. LP-02]
MTRRDESGEAEIRRRIEALVEGIEAKDLRALEGAYAPGVVSFDVEPPLQHVGVAAKLRNWAKVFAVFEKVTYELRDLTLTVGDGVAFGHGLGRLSGTLENGAAAGGMWVRATFCFSRIDGEWLIVHDQVSVPFDLATGRGVTDLQP